MGPAVGVARFFPSDATQLETASNPKAVAAATTQRSSWTRCSECVADMRLPFAEGCLRDGTGWHESTAHPVPSRFPSGRNQMFGSCLQYTVAVVWYGLSENTIIALCVCGPYTPSTVICTENGWLGSKAGGPPLGVSARGLPRALLRPKPAGRGHATVPAGKAVADTPTPILRGTRKCSKASFSAGTNREGRRGDTARRLGQEVGVIRGAQGEGRWGGSRRRATPPGRRTGCRGG
jgi:hypothetical protein